MTKTEEKERGSEVNDAELGSVTDEAGTNATPVLANKRATLWVDGLSVFGFHDSKKWAEVGFIETEHHPVEMRIYKKPGNCDLVWSTEHDFPHSTENIIITVNSTKPGRLGTFFCKGSPGHLSDPNDFCHMPNLAKLFNRHKLPYGIMADMHLTARLRVHDGYFYTYRTSTSDAAIYKNGTEIWRGKIGRVLGADISCDPAETLNIRIESSRGAFDPVDVPLFPLGGSGDYYEIMIRTVPRNNKNHFHHVYDVLQAPLTTLSRFDLKFIPPEPFIKACDDPGLVDKILEPMAGEWICETVTGGGGE